MTTLRNQRKRQFQFEALERRETPSTIGGGTIHELAARPIVFKGSATGAYSSETSAAFSGHATHLGQYTGTLTATGTDTGVVVLTTGNGNLDLNAHGSYGRPSRRGIEHGTFHFDVTGGTDDYAGATGSGKITVTLNRDTGAFSSTISGKYVP